MNKIMQDNEFFEEYLAAQFGAGGVAYDGIESELRKLIIRNNVGVIDGAPSGAVDRLNQALYSGASISVKWQGTDSFTDYTKHISSADTLAQLEHYGWLDADFDYALNPEGWRSRNGEPFDYDQPTVIAVGCSFTFGTGLPFDVTWPYLLSERLGVQCVNLGLPGHGLSLSTLWLSYNWQKFKNICAIVVQQPPPARLSWIIDPGDGLLLPDTLGSGVYDSYTAIKMNQQVNSAVDYIRNKHTLELIARCAGAASVYYSAFGPLMNKGKARDLAHHGTVWHQWRAEQAFDDIKKLLDSDT